MNFLEKEPTVNELRFIKGCTGAASIAATLAIDSPGAGSRAAITGIGTALAVANTTTRQTKVVNPRTNAVLNTMGGIISAHLFASIFG